MNITKLVYILSFSLPVSGCVLTSFKVIHHGNQGKAYSRTNNAECDLVWTSILEDGVVEDVYGEPCFTVIRYKKQNGK